MSNGDLEAELAAARTRIQELLVTIKNLSLSTPYPEEAGSAATLIAEVGTLRSRITALEDENLRMRTLLARLPFASDLERMLGKFTSTDYRRQLMAYAMSTGLPMPPGMGEGVDTIMTWLGEIVAMHKEIVGGGN